MNTTPVVVRGTVRPDGTLDLEGSVSLPPGPVRVTIQPVPTPATPQSPGGLVEVLDAIHAGQRARGYPGRSAEEMEAGEAQGRAEEEEYEGRWRRIWNQVPPSEGAP